MDFGAVNNYYPFGMLMPDMSWQSSGYRYGYNGMEMDNDIKGTGNHLSTHFRGLDPRVGRWWSPDPKPNPSISSYASMELNPILNIDPLGDTIKVEGELNQGQIGAQTEFSTNQRAHLNKMQETEKGKKIYYDLQNSQKIYTIVNKIPKSGHAEYKDKKIYAGNLNDKSFKSYVELGHEIYHAYQAEKGIMGRSIEREVEAYLFTGFLANQIGENIISNKLGLDVNEKDNEYSFRSAFIKLQTADKFSPELFSKTTNLFKSGSPWNKDRLYDKFDVLGDKFKPTINQLYPLKGSK